MRRSALAATAAACVWLAAAVVYAHGNSPFLSHLKKISTVASTVPANGDVNPYGLVLIHKSAGRLQAGDLLISNFNDKANNQGTGRTIVEISPSGHRTQFAHLRAHHLHGRCPGGVGLTTALNVLPGGYVVVGSLPTTNGKSATAKAGCLIVMNDMGQPIRTISGPRIQGPWDSTVTSNGSKSDLFVSMALNGGAKRSNHVVDNATVLRIRLRSSAGHAPKVLSETVVANRIPHRNDAAALVIGPTGLALSAGGTLYVADTLDSRVAAVAGATTRTTAAHDAGKTVTQGGHLNGPLGLTLAPNGDILTANAGDGNVVETTPGGSQVAVRTADTQTGAGSLFGLAVSQNGHALYFVDDGDNTLKSLH